VGWGGGGLWLGGPVGSPWWVFCAGGCLGRGSILVPEGPSPPFHVGVGYFSWFY
jgi:hypothetical protein